MTSRLHFKVTNIVMEQWVNNIKPTHAAKRILVKTLFGKIITLHAKPNDTIQQLKRMIEDKENIPLQMQTLTFASNRLDNNKTLRDYNLQTDTTLHLLLTPVRQSNVSHNSKTSIQIFVKHYLREIILDVEPTDTIQTVKAYIEDKESIPYNKQRLMFQSEELENNKTVTDCNIKNESTLGLLERNVAPDFKEIEYLHMDKVKQIKMDREAFVSLLSTILKDLSFENSIFNVFV